MLRIGLSGGIGSGKSTVAALLVERGAVLIDADQIARAVVAPGTAGLAAVFAAFGDAVRAPDDSLDRAALAGIVFADPGALARLEAITHPLIWAEAAQQFAAAGDRVVVHDMPLLVEKRMSGDYHVVVIVTADETVRVRRLVARGLPADQAYPRIRAQASDAQRRAAADLVIDNNGAAEALAEQVEVLWRSALAPFAANLRSQRAADDVAWLTADAVALAQRAARTTLRLTRAAGGPGRLVELVRESRRLVLTLALDRQPDAAARHRLTGAGFISRSDHLLADADPLWPTRIALTWPGAGQPANTA